MKFLVAITFLTAVTLVYGDRHEGSEVDVRVKRNSCMQNCNSYNCNCPPSGGNQPLCKVIKVQNKWVVDAANCVSFCVHQSNENNGGYCKDNSCFCTKMDKPMPKPTKALCELIKVNGKLVINAANCVSHCVHMSAENSGGYCNQDSCFCQKREVKKSLCEMVFVNNQWVTDSSACSANCVHSSNENSGGYCQQNTCFCQKFEKKKPLCDVIKVQNQWVTDASGCVSYCVKLTPENNGGYCKQDSCFCTKPEKQPLCQVIKVNNKWVADASGCAKHCYQVYKGMKNYGYCQNNTCYCK